MEVLVGCLLRSHMSSILPISYVKLGVNVLVLELKFLPLNVSQRFSKTLS